jgi:hypothetical protein
MFFLLVPMTIITCSSVQTLETDPVTQSELSDTSTSIKCTIATTHLYTAHRIQRPRSISLNCLVFSGFHCEYGFCRNPQTTHNTSVHSFDFNRHARLLTQKRSSFSVQDTAETAVLNLAPSSGSCIYFNVALRIK